LRLDDGDIRTVEILADVPVISSGASLGLQVNGTSGLEVDGNVSWVLKSVQSGSKVAYVGFAPSRVAIDGAFADWAARAPMRDILWDAYSNKTKDNQTGDVDISVVKLASTDDVASFYMSVNGTMLGGASVPSSLVRWVTPSAPAANITNITEPMLGSDFAFVFIDSDQNLSTGYYVGGSEIALVVIGKSNTILDSAAYVYQAGQWLEIGPVDASIDSYQLELSGAYSTLGLTPNETYAITFMAQDWSGREDDIQVPLPARLAAGTRSYPGIIINEICNKAPSTAYNDWIELFNTASVPISLAGFELYVGGVLVYTFPDITLQPGEIYLVTGLRFPKATTYVLLDPTSAIVDQVTTPVWQVNSYGRVGTEPWSTWNNMKPTPGTINNGQIIPEFDSVVIIAGAIVPIILIAIRRARRKHEASSRPLEETKGGNPP
jgi:hypothetical protein